MPAANLCALRKIGLIFLCSAMLCVFHTRTMAAPLYTELTRLHIIANSDSAEDQMLKLEVRDRVLAITEQLTRDADNASDARRLLSEQLDTIQLAAQETVYRNGASYPVSVTLEDNVFFDRRVYDTFSLPAGEYCALRVKIGAARGKNWWCVVFPPLCTSAAIAETAAAELGSPAFRLMTDTGELVELRFWILDFLSKMGK